MIKGIETAQVYDPALDDVEGELIPSRIELVLDPEVDLETITYEKDDGDWVVYHYGRFMRIEPSMGPSDAPWEVGDFNAVRMFPEAVVPVSVIIESKSGNYLQDYYIRYSEARQILDWINLSGDYENETGGVYTLVANEAWARVSKVDFRIQHTAHYCVRCIRENGYKPPNVPGGKPVEIGAKRIADLCERHEAARRVESRARRLELNN